MKIAGFVPLSTVDASGHNTAVIFVQGCPMKCINCQNPATHDPKKGLEITERGIQRMLDGMKTPDGGKFVDWVTISGGEPLFNAGTTLTIARIAKKNGFKVAMETSGYKPHTLGRLLQTGQIDAVYLDCKADLRGDHYFNTTRMITGGIWWEALWTALAYPIELQIRTTTFEGVSEPDYDLIEDDIKVRLMTSACGGYGGKAKYIGWKKQAGVIR